MPSNRSPAPGFNYACPRKHHELSCRSPHGLNALTYPSWAAALDYACRCPECEFGSIDLGMNGDGRWQIEWYPVPCNTGSDPIEVELAGIASNPYYFMFTVSNTRWAGVHAWLPP